MKGCQEQPVSGTGGPVGEGLVGKIVGPAIQKIISGPAKEHIILFIPRKVIRAIIAAQRVAPKTAFEDVIAILAAQTVLAAPAL